MSSTICAAGRTATNYIIEQGRADEAYLRDCTVAPLLVVDETGSYLRMSDLGVEPTEGPLNPLTGQPAMIDPLVVTDGMGQTAVLGEMAEPVIRGRYQINGIDVTTAYELLVERVAEWPVERAAEVCDIPEQTIVDLAEMYLDGPSHLEVGFGNDHWGNGASITHAQFTLAMVAGQWGIKGGGIGGTQGAATNGIPGANYLGMYYLPGAQYTGFSTYFGDFHDIVDEKRYGDREVNVQSLLITTGNPLACSPDRERIMRTLEQIDFVVCCDWLMTDSARWSDIVLPVAHWFEFEAINPCPTPYADLQEICVPPQFESKPDVEIVKLLGTAMGFGDSVDFDDESWNRLALDSDTCRNAGITWERIKEEKHVRFAPETYYYGSREYPFLTPTGRGQFYLENVAPRFPHGQELDTARLALPSFELPDEGWNEGTAEFPKYEIAEKYPLVLMSHRDKFKVHTTFALHPWFLELQPEPTIEMNPEDAEVRGISEGDYVRAYNDRGYCVFRAHLDSSMRPGVTITEHTWAQEQYVDGHYCSLTSRASSQFKPAPHPFDTLVEVEAVEGR